MSSKKPQQTVTPNVPAQKAPAQKTAASKSVAGKSPMKAVGMPGVVAAGKSPTKAAAKTQGTTAAGKSPAKTAGTAAAGKSPAKTSTAGKSAAAKTAASKTPGEKKPSTTSSAARKAANKRKTETYQTYIYKILKQVGSGKGIGISNKGMMVMNSFVEDLFERIATEASHLAKLGNRGTLGAREIATAARLILPQDLGRHACAEAQKAVTKFLQEKEDKNERKTA
jgi:histone H2B